MDRTEIATIVRERIASVLGVSPAEVIEGTDLRVEYEPDSLELMEMGARLEMAFGVRLKVDDLIGLTNVGQAVDLLAAHLDGTA